MKIEKIELHNWKQHRAVSVEINATTVGLVGDNGRGKSNFLGAIESLLTGQFEPEKSRCITWGEEEGYGKIQICLPDGRKMTVYRELHSSVAWLDVTNQPRIIGATKTNAEIQRLLGVNLQILTDVVFVRQDQIQKLLFGGVDKERLAAKFFGVEKAAGLEKALSAEINKATFDPAGDTVAAVTVECETLVVKVEASKKEWGKNFSVAILDSRIADLEKRRQLNTALVGRLNVYHTLSNEITRMDRQLQTLNDALGQKEQAIKANEAALATIDIALARRMRPLHEKQQEANQEIFRQQALLKRYTNEVEAVGQIPYSEEDLAPFVSELAEVKIALAAAEALEKEKSRLLKLKGEMPVVTAEEMEFILTPQMIEKVRMEIQEFCGKKGGEEAFIRQKQSIVDKVGNVSTCPTCGGVIDQKHYETIRGEITTHRGLVDEYQKIVARYQDSLRASEEAAQKVQRRDEITELANEASNAGKTVVEKKKRKAQLEEFIGDKPAAIAKWKQDKALADRQLANCQTELVKLGEPKTATPDIFRQVEEGYGELDRLIGLDRTALEEQRQQHTQLSASLATQRAELAKVEVFSDGKLVEAVADTEFTEELDRLRALKPTQVQLEEQIRVTQTQLNGKRAELQRAEVAEKKNLVTKRYVEKLTIMRDAFHPDGGPKICVTRGNQAMEANVNAYLVMLEAEFTAKAIEGLNFECTFPDGVARQTELSGGQCVDMSWAFRLGAIETFASGVGMMTMDEPTVWLDAKSKDRFNDLIEHLKLLADKYGMQFLISTHDTNLIPHFGQVLSF